MMKKLSFMALFLFIMWACNSAFAGGTGTETIILNFERLSDTKYVLVVRPTAETTYWAMENCQQLEVRGDYTFLKPPVTKEGHLEALAFIESKKENSRFFLGSFGGGFKLLNSKGKCTAISKGLMKYDGLVFSFHDPV